jgi:translation initiation factor 2B subunit (eIF-2B alpha/beta/delta family)
VGSLPLALACAHFRVPLLVAASEYKLAHRAGMEVLFARRCRSLALVCRTRSRAVRHSAAYDTR